MLDMIPFEHTGLQEIRKISPAARHACEFQTLLLVHSAQAVNEQPHTLFIDTDDGIDSDTGRVDELVIDFDTYALTIECDLEATGALLRMKFDSQVISRDQVGTFAAQFESILRQLCSSQVSELTIADLRIAGQRSGSNLEMERQHPGHHRSHCTWYNHTECGTIPTLSSDLRVGWELDISRTRQHCHANRPWTCQ